MKIPEREYGTFINN